LFLIRSLIGKVISLAIVLLVVAGVGWYFLIREDNEVQKEAAPVSDAVKQAAAASPTTAAAAATTGVSASPTVAAPAAGAASTLTGKNYKLVDGQSLAWYLAPEKLSRLPTSSVAKGQTSDVKGEFHLTADGLNPAKPTKLTVGVARLKSEEARRDDRMRDALETTKFPTATFTATKLTGMPKDFTATDTVMHMTGILNVHGVAKEVTWELKVKRDGEILSGLATVKVKYTDFGMTKPAVAGFVTVEDELTLQIQLFATPS